MNMDGLIGHLVDTAGSFTDEELLLLSYYDYEKGAEGSCILNSDVKDDVLARGVDIAIGMYHDGRVSLGRGAELAGVPLREFQDELLDRFGYIYVCHERGRRRRSCQSRTVMGHTPKTMTDCIHPHFKS